MREIKKHQQSQYNEEEE
jgi:hypothetical protein